MIKFTDVMRKKAAGKIPKDELYAGILEFLKGQTMCTICTSLNDVPRATPLEYYSDGTSLYIIGHKGIKLGNLRANPRVSVAIYNHVHPTWGGAGNWLGVKGAQITGTARIITDDSPEYFTARAKWKSPTVGTVKSSEKPTGRMMIVVDSERIEYMDSAFKLEGCATKQVWKADKPGGKS